jgi:polyisoprenoid-binding protein YceI
MKNLIKSSLFMLITVFSINFLNAQQAHEWKLDKSHASVNFSINHFFSAVTGKFSDFDGSFYFDSNNPEGSNAEFTIKVASINTDDKKRDNHLQSKDFFDAKSYPEMKFVSSRIEKKSDKEFIAHGKLTIRDVTKEVALPFKVTGEMEHPKKKGTIILGLLIDYKLDRTEYGVGTGSWAATAVVGDEVRISIPLELTRKK